MVSKCNGSYLYQSHQPLLVRNISESVYYHPKVKFLCNYIHNFLKSTLYQMYAIWRRNKVIYDQTMQILTQRFLSVSVAQSRPTLCDPMDCMQPTRLFCPWNSPDKNTRVGNHSLLQGDLPNLGIKLRSPALQADSVPSEPSGKSYKCLGLLIYSKL